MGENKPKETQKKLVPMSMDTESMIVEKSKKLVPMSMNTESMIVEKSKELGMPTEDKEMDRTNKDSNCMTDNNKDECFEREMPAYKKKEDQ